MNQYDYDVKKDQEILAALMTVWNPPQWAAAYAPNDQGVTSGNCIRAARFAKCVLDLVNVQCEVTAVRARTKWGRFKYTHNIGWGDCGSYMAPSPGNFPAHAVVIGHDWLLDVAAEQLGEEGPTIAFPAEHGVWKTEEETVYTWAPGLRYAIYNEPDWGSKAPATRLAREIRKIAGPCRKPRSYNPNGPW